MLLQGQNNAVGYNCSQDHVLKWSVNVKEKSNIKMHSFHSHHGLGSFFKKKMGIQLRLWCVLFNKAQTLRHILVGLVRRLPIHQLMILPHGWSFPTIFNGSLILLCIFTGSLPAGQGLLKTYELQGRQLTDVTAKTKQYFPEDTVALLWWHGFSWQWKCTCLLSWCGPMGNLVLIKLHFK